MLNKSLTLFSLCQGWQPPFACDVDRLHFTPRIQRLNELEVRPLFASCLLQILYLQIWSCGFIKPNLETSMTSFWSATLKSSGFNSIKVINKKQGHWWKITIRPHCCHQHFCCCFFLIYAIIQNVGVNKIFKLFLY